jgi:hypothetical protein
MISEPARIGRISEIAVEPQVIDIAAGNSDIRT